MGSTRNYMGQKKQFKKKIGEEIVNQQRVDFGFNVMCFDTHGVIKYYMIFNNFSQESMQEGLTRIKDEAPFMLIVQCGSNSSVKKADIDWLRDDLNVMNVKS